MRLIDVKRRIVAALGDGAGRESELILSHVYGFEQSEMPLRLFDEVLPSAALDDILSRRIGGEPLEYILGKTVFCGLDFDVSPDCLIPQADTEVVAEEAAAQIKNGGRFLDLCTGSGCIAVAVAKITGACGVAVDISEKALDIAKTNAEKNGVSDKIEFVRADVFQDETFDGVGKFDLVVSNPPYVKTADIPSLSREVRREPFVALDGGDDGMKFYRRITAVAPSLLKKGGALVLEVGYDTAESVCALLEKSGFEYKLIKDYGNNSRCVSARLAITEA